MHGLMWKLFLLTVQMRLPGEVPAKPEYGTCFNLRFPG
jgi:hypothetical protein